METCDYLIVGAGFAGLVLAERLATQLGSKCLVVDRRHHIGGNAYDEVDQSGVLVHKYGPHYFRTNSTMIREYLSRFTSWSPVSYQILSYTEGRYWSFPINLNTFEQLIGRASTTEEFEAYLAEKKVPAPLPPRNSEDVIVSQIGWDLYRKFFEGYTLKQWRRHPRDLDASVCGRIPIRKNRDDRYLNEAFQALPAAGYFRMFEKMVGASPLIEVRLGTDYREARKNVSYQHLIYTGPIDEFYDHCDGHLPYRSLRFEPESFGPKELRKRLAIAGKPGFWQPAVQVNYPNDEAYTRIVEMKHATGQLIDNSTIIREYPSDYGPGKEPYYPIPAPDSEAIYRKYAARAKLEKAVFFVGRLATYRYYNMDQVVGMALAKFDEIREFREMRP